MIKVEPCIGCGRLVLQHRIANLVVKCDPVPLDNPGDIVRLITSPNPPGLWMVEKDQQDRPTRLRGARPGELGPVQEHRCPVNAQEALSRPRSTPPGPSPQPTPHEPPVGQQTPFSGPQAAPSSARHAVRRRSELTHDCSLCGHPIRVSDVETYALIQLGAAVIDAFHTTGCP